MTVALSGAGLDKAPISNPRPVHKLTAASDVNPLIRPRWSTISDERKGKRNGQGQAHGGADHRGAEAGGSRSNDRGCGSGVGSFQVHAVRLEVEVRRHGCERGAGGKAAPRRERATEETGCGPQPRQGHAAVGDSK